VQKTDNSRIAALLREMAAMGVHVDVSVVEPDVEIVQVGSPSDSMVFDLPVGRAGCIIEICIVNQTSKPIPVRSVELCPTWQNSEFEWLPDPKEMQGDPFNYHFPGKGAPEFPRKQVLNHVLLDRGVLRPGRPVEGWLLAVGNPKPEELLPGGFVDFTLTILGHDHCGHVQMISLRVDPVWKCERGSSRKRSTENLFARERAQNPGSLKPGNKVGVTSLRR